jgi:hypothetical protein
MAIERDDDGPQPALGGQTAHLGDDRLVPEMNSVVCADGDDRAVTIEWWVGVGNHDHEG